MEQTYTVKRGDTLYGISNQFGVSVVELSNLNNVKAESLKVGQVLKIPNKSGTNPSNMFMYTVKKGDSLYKIAIKYNTTVNEIKKLNNLVSDNLSIGDVLKIPENYSKETEMTMPSFINYTVKKGDSLYSIAKNNNVSIETIIKDNSLSNNNLSIGQILKIRVEDDLEVEECFSEDYGYVDNDNYINYVVVKGDTLYKIASKYNTSITNLMNINNLKSTSLSVNQVLKIPSTANTKKGDSLYSIAKMFNTTVDSIKAKNNLKTNTLSINQELLI